MTEKIIKDVIRWIIETKNTECLDVDDVDMVYKDYMAEKGDDVYALLGDGWRDARKEHPEYYKRVLLLVEENFSGYPQLNTKYLISGYYHADNVYCDYSGQTLNGNEIVLKWSEEPAFA